MTFDQYEASGRPLCAVFAKAVGGIIEAVIIDHGPVNVQQIQDRAKGPASLCLADSAENKT